ncbi:MAG TPA: hypothetical protein VGF77_15975 [Allosphingosinicella sp.]|jgi:hypothetical protein
MANLKLSAANAAIDATNIDDNMKATLKAQMRDAAAPIPDTWIYRIVVIALGLAIFVPLAGLFCGCDPQSRQTLVQMLLPIATAALGALAGLLAPSPASNNG